MVGGAKSSLESNAILPKTLKGVKQTLCAPGPKDTTETETEPCLSISCGGAGRQWSAPGTGALGVGMAYMLLEEVTINPGIELPEFT